MLYFIAFVLAGSSISYELILAQTLSLLGANTVIWYSITVGVFLGSMGVGALWYRSFFKERDGQSLLVFVELLLVALGGAGVILIHLLYMVGNALLLHGFSVLGISLFPIWSLAVVFGIGLLTGIELPLLISLSSRLARVAKANRVLGFDYMGSLAGSILFALFFIPRFEMVTAGLMTAFANLIIVFYLLAVRLTPRKYAKQSTARRRGLIGAAGALAFLLMVGLFYHESLSQYFIKKYYYYTDTRGTVWDIVRPFTERGAVERTRSPYQHIDIIEGLYDPPPQALLDAYTLKYKNDPLYPKNVFLYINGDFQLYGAIDEIYHEWFAHIPILLGGRIPERVLILGGGDGLLDKELLKYKEIKKIIHVDVDETMIALAKNHPTLSRMNKGTLADPRVEIVIDDGYRFVKDTEQKFDAIYADFPFAQDYNTARLYSREFYHFVGNALADGGFIALDAPGSEPFLVKDSLGQMRWAVGSSWRIYYNTLKAAGFETLVPYTTRLETDNEEALAFVEKRYLGAYARERLGKDARALSEEERNRLRKEILEQYMHTFAQGFIFAKKAPEEINRSFAEPDFELTVLTQKRFGLSFPDYPEYGAADRSRVNSILRPVLLETPFWILRHPY